MPPSDFARTATRWTLVTVTAAGTALFVTLCALTVAAPRAIERAAQGYLRAEVEASVRARFGERTDTVLSTMQRTGAVGVALAARADSLRRLAGSDWPERIAPLLDALCCENDSTVDRAAEVRASLEAGATAADIRLATLRSFVVGAYRARLHELVQELRFFAGANAGLFGLVGLLLIAYRSNMRLVLLPSALILVSTLGAATLYATTQDWFWRILLGDYMGAWYLALVAATAAFAADLVFLRGRVSAQVLSNVPAVLVPPC